MTIKPLPADWTWPDDEDVVFNFEFFATMEPLYDTDDSRPHVGDVIRIGQYITEVIEVDPWVETYTLRRLFWSGEEV